MLNDDLIKYIELLCREYGIPFNGCGTYAVIFKLQDEKVHVTEFTGKVRIMK